MMFGKRSATELVQLREQAAKLAQGVIKLQAERDNTARLVDVRTDQGSNSVELVFERHGELHTYAVYKSMNFDHNSMREMLLETQTDVDTSQDME